MKIITFYHFDTDPRFSPFLLYVRCKPGVTFVRRCFRDAYILNGLRNTQWLRWSECAGAQFDIK